MSHDAFQIVQHAMAAMELFALTALLIFALVKAPSLGRPAVLVAIGVGLFMLGRVFSIAMSWIISRWASNQPNVLDFVILQTAVLQIMDFIAIVALVAAAFSSRRGTRSQPPPGGPLAQPENPYSGHL